MKKISLLLFFLTYIYAIDFDNLKANFTQTIHKQNAKITYTGELFFKNNKNLWIYKTPTQKKVYLNGDMISIVDDELEQVIFQKLSDKINIVNILKNAKEKSKNHYEAKYQNTIYSIFIIDDKNINITYKDEDNNNVTLNLTNINQKQTIKNELFVPVYPSDYDEIFG